MFLQAAVKPSLRAGASRRTVKVVCQAQEAAKQVSTAVAAAALATVVGFGNVEAAKADIAGLTPCSQSKAYAKLQKKELKTLNKRLKQVHRWRQSRASQLANGLGKHNPAVSRTHRNSESDVVQLCPEFHLKMGFARHLYYLQHQVLTQQ